MIDKKRLMLGMNCPVNDRLSVKQLKIYDIINDTDTLAYRKNIESKFLLLPKDVFVELYDMKICYWEIDKYKFFVENCYAVYGENLDEFNKCIKYLLVDKETGDDINFNFKIIVQNDILVIYDRDNNILIDNELYNNIREVIKIINFNEDYDIDDSGISGKISLKQAVEIEKDKRKSLGKFQVEKKVKDELEKIMSLVINFGNNNINYLNIINFTLYQIIHSYITLKKVLEYQNMHIGLYCSIDLSKINFNEINDLI